MRLVSVLCLIDLFEIFDVKNSKQNIDKNHIYIVLNNIRVKIMIDHLLIMKYVM